MIIIMIVIAVDNNRYLVKFSKSDKNCYCVDIKLNYVYGYDSIYKFMKFGCYKRYDMSNFNDELENNIMYLLKKFNFNIINK